MFVVLSYDINHKRVHKALKICRKYLSHAHRSVFEGEISEAKLKRLERELEKVIDVENDSIKIYRMSAPRFVEKDEIGKCDTHVSII